MHSTTGFYIPQLEELQHPTPQYDRQNGRVGQRIWEHTEKQMVNMSRRGDTEPRELLLGGSLVGMT